MKIPVRHILLIAAVHSIAASCYNSDGESAARTEVQEGIPAGQSPYDKNVDFGIVPSEYYTGRQASYAFGNASTSTAEIYCSFDALADGTYITKEPIGTASDSSEMFMYRAVSPMPESSVASKDIMNKARLKIIIICAQHGFEKASIYGTLYFLSDLKDHYMDCKVLEYFRQNADILVIPCANPYGIDIQGYLNRNGANLNRNWPVENWQAEASAKKGESAYGGEEGGDQPEVANIVSVLEKHKDAMLVLDFHTSGIGNAGKGGLNWISMTLNDDKYRDYLTETATRHISNITTAFESMYPDEIGGGDTKCGYLDSHRGYSVTGYLSTYAAQQNFLSLTFEGFNGFPKGSVYSDKAKKANSEILGNYLATFCRIYGNID